MPDDLDQANQTARDLLSQLSKEALPPVDSPNKIAARFFRHAGVYPIPNLVVNECDQKFAEAVEQALKEGKSASAARNAGKIAYCAVMPRLSGAANIRDFIACVTYAMSLEIIPGNEGTRLLYAAQVAHQSIKKRSLKHGKVPDKATPGADATHVKSML